MQIVLVLIIAAVVVATLIGFNNTVFFNRYAFSIEGIRIYRQFERFFTSIFLHVDYLHLFFNLFSFYSFAIYVEGDYGSLFLLLLFFGSALGGNLLAFLIHRNHMGYSAAGASGAISGVIFASVLMYPGGSIMVFPIPIGIPSWLFAILFVSISMYGIGKQSGNIGHEAHLGGALTGILITWLVHPWIVEGNLPLTTVLVVPVLVFLYIFIKDPKKLHLKSFNKWK